MHVLIAGVYSVTLYMAALAYVVITNGPLLVFLACTPLFISGAIVAILVIHITARGIAWAFKLPGKPAKTD